MGMVYILDEGSVFDAPIDKIWKYLPSDEHRHNSLKLINREMVTKWIKIVASSSTVSTVLVY